MGRRILLIVNPRAAAGRAQRRWEALLAGLRERGLVVSQVATAFPGHAVELAREACGRYDTLVAAGGDGTVNEVASGILLAGAPRAALGIVPLGTGNDVALQAGIRSLDDALGTLAAGQGRPIDAIEVRCWRGDTRATRYALLYAGVGFASALLKLTTPAVKRLFGPRRCYAVGFLRALFAYGSPLMTVRADEREIRGRIFFACAGNAEHSGGGTMRLSPGARMDDGLLNISIVEAMGRLDILKNFPRLLSGAYTALPGVRYLTAASLAVDSDPPMEIALDGDIFGHTPAEFIVRPAALKLLCLQPLGSAASRPQAS